MGNEKTEGGAGAGAGGAGPAVRAAAGPATNLSSPKATGKTTADVDIEKDDLRPEDQTNFEVYGKKVRFASRSLHVDAALHGSSCVTPYNS